MHALDQDGHGRRVGASTAGALLRTDAITKVFASKDGSKVAAVSRLTVGIHEGEVVCVVGPSGCGKTTLLRLFAGLLRPSAGTALYADDSITGPRSEIAVIFQRPVLLPWKTVLSNVMLPAQVGGGRSRFARGGAESRARELLSLVGLDGWADRYPAELSGGMQQRVSIARGLMMSPKVLLMDEPFGALDALTREQMCAELLRIVASEGTTVFFITHSITEATFLGDRVLVMAGPPGQVIDDVPIDIPAPRTMAVMGLARFGELSSQIRTSLDAGSAGEAPPGGDVPEEGSSA